METNLAVTINGTGAFPLAPARRVAKVKGASTGLIVRRLAVAFCGSFWVAAGVAAWALLG